MHRYYMILINCLVFFSLSHPLCAKSAHLALVIGNSEYKNSIFAPLTNPNHDAKDMAETLKNLGFDVMLHTDVDYRTMVRAVQEFGQRLQERGESTTGVFYFSGHGVQYHDHNFLIPLSTNISIESDIEFEALDINRVLQHMGTNNAQGVNILILDACRKNFYLRGVKGGGEAGFAQMDSPSGTLIAFATSPDTWAYEDSKARNSIYTKHLLDMLHRSPSLSITDLFVKVRQKVKEETNNQQIPWESVSLTNIFRFAESNPIQLADENFSLNIDTVTITATHSSIIVDNGNRIFTFNYGENYRKDWGLSYYFILNDPFVSSFACYDGVPDPQNSDGSITDLFSDYSLKQLSSNDFQKFSFFNHEATTIGLLIGRAGASGGSSQEMFLFDTVSDQYVIIPMVDCMSPAFIRYPTVEAPLYATTSTMSIGPRVQSLGWGERIVAIYRLVNGSYQRVAPEMEKEFFFPLYVNAVPTPQETEYFQNIRMTDLYELGAYDEKRDWLVKLLDYCYYAVKAGKRNELQPFLHSLDQSLQEELQYIIKTPEYQQTSQTPFPLEKSRFAQITGSDSLQTQRRKQQIASQNEEDIADNNSGDVQFSERRRQFIYRCPYVNIREQPAPDASLVTSVPCGMPVEVLGYAPSLSDGQSKWYHIETQEGKQGWAYAGERDSWVQSSSPRPYSPSQAKENERYFIAQCPYVNLRELPTAESSILLHLSCGTVVDIIEYSPSFEDPQHIWYHIRSQAGEEDGWVYGGEENSWFQPVSRIQEFQKN